MGLEFNTQSLPTQSMIYKSDSNGLYFGEANAVADTKNRRPD